MGSRPPARTAAKVVGIVSLGLLLAGCSSGLPSSQSTSAPPADAATPAASPQLTACTLVTEQDATAALGSDPGPGIAAAQSGVTACTYGAAPQMVSVHLSPAGKAGYDQMHSASVDGASLVDLAGIGDAAFGIFAAPIASIGFYRGSSYVSIVIYADGSQDRAMALASAAASRL